MTSPSHPVLGVTGRVSHKCDLRHLLLGPDASQHTLGIPPQQHIPACTSSSDLATWSLQWVVWMVSSWQLHHGCLQTIADHITAQYTTAQAASRPETVQWSSSQAHTTCGAFKRHPTRPADHDTCAMMLGTRCSLCLQCKALWPSGCGYHACSRHPATSTQSFWYCLSCASALLCHHAGVHAVIMSVIETTCMPG